MSIAQLQTLVSEIPRCQMVGLKRRYRGHMQLSIPIIWVQLSRICLIHAKLGTDIGFYRTTAKRYANNVAIDKPVVNVSTLITDVMVVLQSFIKHHYINLQS